MRMSNHRGYKSYHKIVIPIAMEINYFALQMEKYPMTIIYLKLKYCGYHMACLNKTYKISNLWATQNIQLRGCLHSFMLHKQNKWKNALKQK